MQIKRVRLSILGIKNEDTLGGIMVYNFKNYVFEGGGVKGLAYVGALKVLEEKGIHNQITRVGGASAGAICALLVALNYSSDEMRDILWKMNFKEFMDGSWGIFGNLVRLVNHYGFFKGDFFENWIKDIIKSKTGSESTTFKELKEHVEFKEVAFIGTNLSTHFSETFSAKTTPDMKLYKALRITMSIPLFFESIKMNHDNIYVDGGLLMNYPIKLFDRMHYVENNFKEKEYYNKGNEKQDLNSYPEDRFVYNTETLGFRLDSKYEIDIFKDKTPPKVSKINNFIDYAWNILESFTEAQQNAHLHTDDWHRTIYIDSIGIKTTDFSLTDVEKENLEKSGEDYTRKYFEWYDNEGNDQLNKAT